ncbi:PREDICTED: general odorant-binding protein 56d-like [Bactrocera latifrons]|uniref:general odorant-binding protein 56d-like n=1 Tax=Bactrocera latifrons TaxID=174628 RepID=UPI0008DDA423|nr:PREDICTED: general odorant-binding protein 56d-like [Bactrocera latifrons]
MKSFILVAALIALSTVAAHELKSNKSTQVHQFYDDCLKQSGASAAQLDALKKGDFNAVDDKVKCFLKCVQNKKGILANGIPNEIAIHKVLKPAVGNSAPKDILAKCNGLNGANECDTAFQIYKCYWQEHVILI